MYSVVDASMKSIAGFGSYFMFKEHADWSDVVAFGLVVASFIPMIFADRKSSSASASTPPPRAPGDCTPLLTDTIAGSKDLSASSETE